eukprot:TRINITY_DN67159_c7_g1_i3.p1 TRINITY_DN67159_c7_g1~~TRINITY_DN67159_c7_g1_i3.p1  ORF type:complete len:310 (+),score=32.18 TRINITY_DN67159_c7_g1_i3:82-1011(+)
MLARSIVELHPVTTLLLKITTNLVGDQLCERTGGVSKECVSKMISDPDFEQDYYQTLGPLLPAAMVLPELVWQTFLAGYFPDALPFNIVEEYAELGITLCVVTHTVTGNHTLKTRALSVFLRHYPESDGLKEVDKWGDAIALERGKQMTPLILTEREIKVLTRFDIQWLLLRRCIPTDGASTLEDFRKILRKNIRKKPTPPSWYSPKQLGQPGGVELDPFGRVGLFRCDNYPECHKTETEVSGRFRHCSKCRYAHYCSNECQRADWKKKHKKLCLMCCSLSLVTNTCFGLPVADCVARVNRTSKQRVKK